MVVSDTHVVARHTVLPTVAVGAVSVVPKFVPVTVVVPPPAVGELVGATVPTVWATPAILTVCAASRTTTTARDVNAVLLLRGAPEGLLAPPGEPWWSEMLRDTPKENCRSENRATTAAST